MAQRQKRLNIYNTDRYYNVNLMKRADIDSKTKVTRLNEAEVAEEMTYLEETSIRYPRRNGTEYLIYQEKYKNDTLIQQIMEHGGGVTYYTDSIVPYHVLKAMAKNLNSECVYAIRPEFSDAERANIELAFMATKVVVDLPVVVPDVNPYDALFILHDLKTNVDNVQISFPMLREEEISARHLPYYIKKGNLYQLRPAQKFAYFKYLQTSLSIWKMNIWIVCDDDADFLEVQHFVNKDLNKRSGGAKKEQADG